MLWLWVGLAFGAADPIPSGSGSGECVLSVGGGAWAGTRTTGGQAGGRLSVRVGSWGLAAWAREGVMSGSLRVVGSVGMSGQFVHGSGLTVRAGLIHHHETPWEAFRLAPMGALLGTADGITHRTGMDVAVGARRWLERTGDGRWGLWIEGGVAVFPDASGPPVYGGVEAGVSLAWHRW